MITIMISNGNQMDPTSSGLKCHFSPHFCFGELKRAITRCTLSLIKTWIEQMAFRIQQNGKLSLTLISPWSKKRIALKNSKQKIPLI